MPKPHEFIYNIYYLCMDIDQIDESSNAFFSVNGWNLISFFKKDHARYSQERSSSDGDLRKWLEHVHSQAGHDFKPAQAWLQAFPRILGYTFNPISVWYSYNDKQELISILCEVNNTFGETHNYLLTHPGLAPIQNGDAFESNKNFHVSPFFNVQGMYKFKVTGHPLSNESKSRLDIIYYDQNTSSSPTLVTWMQAEKNEWSSSAALKTFLGYPLLTVKIIFLIHFHALLLFFKKAKFYKKPESPNSMSTAAAPIARKS
ncbi:MAG: DUF1365 domain-containing protein [Bdellovibrionota bacterium]